VRYRVFFLKLERVIAVFQLYFCNVVQRTDTCETVIHVPGWRAGFGPFKRFSWGDGGGLRGKPPPPEKMPGPPGCQTSKAKSADTITERSFPFCAGVRAR
jgi:hypothetical protein